MKVLPLITIFGCALPSALALAAANPIPSLFDRGEPVSFLGQCTSAAKCMTKGGVGKKYDCMNSKCNTSDLNKECTIARDQNGHYKAKCPTTTVPYEWDWPWLDCKLKKNAEKGTCAKPDCKLKEAKEFWNCKHPPAASGQWNGDLRKWEAGRRHEDNMLGNK